jgi:ketosteroid isomerase-like protein
MISRSKLFDSPGEWRGTIFATVAAMMACAITVSAQDQAKSSDLTEVLTGILSTQADAWNEGDLVKFMDAYWNSEELTFSGGGNTTRGWQATLDRYRRNYGDKETMGHLTFSELEVTPLGTDAAMMLGRFNLLVQGKNSGGNFTLVWRKMDGRWQIIHDHSSSDANNAEDSESQSSKPRGLPRGITMTGVRSA